MNGKLESAPFKIVIQGDPGEEPPLENIASFLRHLVYLHDRLVILASPQYRQAAWSSHFFYRTGRPLKGKELLKVYHLKQESPIEIGIIIGAAIAVPPAAKAFVEFIKMIRDWKPDREYKTLRSQQLRLEIECQMKELGMVKGYPLAAEEDERQTHPSEVITKDIIRIVKDEITITNIEIIEVSQQTE